MTGKINLNTPSYSNSSFFSIPQLIGEPTPTQVQIANDTIKKLGIELATDLNPTELHDTLRDKAAMYSKKATEMTVIRNALSCILKSMRNPSIQSSILRGHLNQYLECVAPKEWKEEVFKNLKLFHKEKANEILEKNPRILLQIKNKNGKDLIEQYLDYLEEMILNLRDASTLYHIQDLLGSQGISLVNFQIFSAFNHLSPTNRKKLCIQLKNQLENSVSEDEILGRIEQNPKILLQSSLKTNALEHRLNKIELQTHRSFVFTGAYQLPDSISDGDSLETASDILMIHQLHEFYFQLLKPNSQAQNEVIFDRFTRLNPEIKTVIGKTLWIAHYKPDIFNFGDTVIQKNPRVLLECKSRDGRDLVLQLIDHYKNKITLQRFIPVYIDFINNFNRADTKELQLEAFNQLPDFAKSDLAELLWLEHGGKNNPHFGWLTYGTDKINENPNFLNSNEHSILEQYKALLKQKLTFKIDAGIEKYENEMTLPSGVIDCSAAAQLSDSTLKSEIPQEMRIAMVTAEYRGVISKGGLAPAVEGMASAYGANKTRVILPKYDVIHPKIKLIEKPKYEVHLNGKVHRIFKATVDGVKCYFIEDALFNVGRNKEGKPNNIYEASKGSINPDADKKRRWVHFQSHAAELVYKFSKKQKNPVQLIHLHDAQTGLIPRIMKTRHFGEWQAGLTPSMVFTYHNNNEQIIFSYTQVQDYLREIGLPGDPINSFVDGLKHADMNTTVSKKYASETQVSDYGKEVQRDVKINAHQKKLVGIVNGNSNGWNPKTDEQLKNWMTAEGGSLDLSYGPDDEDLPEKILLIRQQLAEYLIKHDLAIIDPKKPIFFYVGRYDSSQKGIDKLPLIMKEALKNNAQFICIGLDPDEKADAALKEMEAFANSEGKEGVCIIRDFERPSDGRLYWQQGNTKQDKSGVPGFGNLLRAAVDIGIFPSIFEPCGLVQGEMHRMGVETAATETGGFADTIFTSGPNRNGFLFPRIPKWESGKQNDAIAKTVKEAAEKSQARLNDLYSEDAQRKQASVSQKRTIMRNAAQSTWKSTFDGSLSPKEQIELVYAKSLRNRKQRGVIPADLHGLNGLRVLTF